jgi:hypothetical protein
MVAQVFNLCMRRLKPAATKNYLMIATWYYNREWAADDKMRSLEME